jgi:hypothetical protein
MDIHVSKQEKDLLYNFEIIITEGRLGLMSMINTAFQVLKKKT